MAAQEFSAGVESAKTKAFIVLPFNPDEAWGSKPRHHVNGTVNGHSWRGTLVKEGDFWLIPLGEAFRRDTGIHIGDTVRVILSPEGPQIDNVSPDIALALKSEPQAQEFFAGLPTFYRKNYLRWIDSAKREETRAARIAEMVELLKAGKREK